MNAAEGLAVLKTRQGAGQLSLERLSVRAPGPGEVRIEVAAAGICGTDIHIADDEWPSQPPVALGHEVAGIVRELGEGVSADWAGARVACETFFSTDERCPLCRSGRPNLCRERCSIGSGVDGGFAARLVVPERNLRRLPDWLPLEAGVLMEPLACVCNCLCDPAEVNVGDRVLVLGAGPIGLLAAQVARAAGATVLVADLDVQGVRLRTASKLGFDVAAADDEHALEGYGGELGYDVAIECAGSEGATVRALQQLRPRGRLVQVGLVGADVSIPIDLVVVKEVVVRGGLAGPPRAWERAQAIVAARRVELEPLLTTVLPIAEWEAGFALARAGEAVKVALVPASANGEQEEGSA